MESPQSWGKPVVLTQHLAGPPTPAPVAVAPPPANATDGVDAEGAVLRLAGNTLLYASILRSYLKDLSTQPAQLAQLLQQGDVAGAARLLHTLKGVSTTVGAPDMATTAKAAEAQLLQAQAGPPLPASRVSALCADFDQIANSTVRVMQPLVQLYEDQAPAPGGVDPDTANLHADLGELQLLLADSDLKALDVHARVQIAGPRTGVTGFAELEEAIRDFDFARGAALCGRLMDALMADESHTGPRQTTTKP